MALDNYSVTPAGDMSGGLAGLGQVLQHAMGQRKQMEEEEAQRAAQAEALTALRDAYHSGDPNQLMEVSFQYPQISEMAYKAAGMTQDYQKREADQFALDVLANPAGAVEAAQRRVELLKMQNRDASHSEQMLARLQENPEAEIERIKMGLAWANPEAFKAYNEAKGGQSEVPAAMQTLQLRAAESGLEPGTPEYQEFMRTGGNRSGLASAVTRTYDNGTVLQTLPDGSTKVLGPDGNEVSGQARVDALRKAREEQVDFAASRAGATARAEGEEGRIQTTIDEGLDASQGVATLYRAVDLLDEVKTGGWNAAAIKAKQLFGIESADEGELASALGKGVLSQLRSTFGAAFTEREGARLEGIEARMGASPEANKRMLQQAIAIMERAANRAIDAAYEIGDTRTARDIEDLLDSRLTDTGVETNGDVIAEADAILSGAGL